MCIRDRLAAFDAFRRMSTALGGRGVAEMIRAGLLTEDMTRGCLLYTSDAADERSSVDLGGRRII